LNKAARSRGIFMATNDSNLIWLDLEMTGLEPKKDVILEMATIVTDSQ
jgi:oligoribonuclease